jgi:hypothetical protein
MKTITAVSVINPSQLKDDKVSTVANAMKLTTEEATKLVTRLEKQQEYRRQYQQSEKAREYRKQRYLQLKQVAALLRVK